MDKNYIQQVENLALGIGNYLTHARTRDGKPISEGMVFAALGLLFASKAQDEAHMQDIIRNLHVAIYNAYRMKEPR